MIYFHQMLEFMESSYNVYKIFLNTTSDEEAYCILYKLWKN